MEQQKNLVQEKDWDSLIILDACRYDYFKSNYGDFLEGDLEKVESPVDTRKSFATTDWCKKVFEGGNFGETVYFSSTPRVNSRTEVDGFKANQHFSEIIDLWQSSWNEEYGTVMPKEVTESVKRRLNISKPEKTIIHYLQPHCPYITTEPPLNVKNNNPEARKNLKNRLMVLLGPKMRDFLGPQKFLEMTEMFNLPPVDHLQEVLRNRGEEDLKDLYIENLREALKEVEKLKDLEGKTVITADHGEYLGRTHYGHSFVPNGEEVNRVPWFVVGTDS
jgi:hypothetical protein